MVRTTLVPATFNFNILHAQPKYEDLVGTCAPNNDASTGYRKNLNLKNMMDFCNFIRQLNRLIFFWFFFILLKDYKISIRIVLSLVHPSYINVVPTQLHTSSPPNRF